jgi:hypothetical protein
VCPLSFLSGIKRQKENQYATTNGSPEINKRLFLVGFPNFGELKVPETSPGKVLNHHATFGLNMFSAAELYKEQQTDRHALLYRYKRFTLVTQYLCITLY